MILVLFLMSLAALYAVGRNVEKKVKSRQSNRENPGIWQLSKVLGEGVKVTAPGEAPVEKKAESGIGTYNTK